MCGLRQISCKPRTIPIYLYHSQDDSDDEEEEEIEETEVHTLPIFSAIDNYDTDGFKQLVHNNPNILNYRYEEEGFQIVIPPVVCLYHIMWAFLLLIYYCEILLLVII